MERQCRTCCEKPGGRAIRRHTTPSSVCRDRKGRAVEAGTAVPPSPGTTRLSKGGMAKHVTGAHRLPTTLRPKRDSIRPMVWVVILAVVILAYRAGTKRGVLSFLEARWAEEDRAFLSSIRTRSVRGRPNGSAS